MERRALTMLLYLNPGWDAAADGGCLRVHSPRFGARDISPTLGRVVLFDARRVWHEVLPSAKRRLALTQWIDYEREP